MATASGFSFGGTSNAFGSTAKTTASAFPAFGAAATSGQSTSLGFGFGAAKTTAATSASGLSFNNSLSSSTTGTGLSFGKPAASVSAFTVTKTSQPSQQVGFSTFSTPGTASTGLGFGQNLFGAKATTITTQPQLTAATTSQASNLFAFGAKTSSTVVATTSTSNIQAPLENPKDAQVPAPLMAVYQELSKHIKEQRVKKDEIARFSAQLINKATEEIATLKQLVSEGSNGVQRDAVAVENLKSEATQELKFAEIARRVNDSTPSLQYDFDGPMQYFQHLAESFQTRLIMYRQQLDELEMYLSSASPLSEFTPQDLFNVLRKLNDTFLGLASQLQDIHETVKAVKDKYSQYRRVVLNDASDVFGLKPRLTQRNGGMRGTGPCPFSGLAGPSGSLIAAKVSESATGSKPSTGISNLGSSSLGQQTLLKSASGLSSSGMSRSLSFSGLSTRNDNTSASLGSSLTSSLFGKVGSTSNTPQFQLQNPPGTKRGKVN